MSQGGRATAQYPGQIWNGSTPTRSDPNGDNLDIWRKPDAGDYAQAAAEIIGIQNQLETGYQYDMRLHFDAVATPSVANDVSGSWLLVPRACKLIKAAGTVKVAPTTSGGLQFDIKFSTDDGATWTSLWATNTGNKPSITVVSSLKYVTQTSFDTTTLAENTLLRLDVLAVDGGTTAVKLGVSLLIRTVK